MMNKERRRVKKYNKAKRKENTRNPNDKTRINTQQGERERDTLEDAEKLCKHLRSPPPVP